MTVRPHRSGGWALVFAACLGLTAPAVTTQAASPPGTMTWALHVTVAAQWLDPAETAALASPYLVL